MTKRKTTLIQKDPQKGTTNNNYRPIMCLPMMWKIIMVQIREDIYNLLISQGTERIPQVDQRRATIHWSTHPQGEQDKMENPAMVWIDYKKAYDMVPQSWIIDCLKMYKTSGKVIKFVENTMENWIVKLTAGGKSLAEVKIQRGIFQGEALLPLLFVRVMMLRNHIRGAYNKFPDFFHIGI